MITREEAISAINKESCFHRYISFCSACKDEIRAMLLEPPRAQPTRKIIALNTNKIELYFPKDKDIKLCKEDRLIRTVAFNDNTIWANLSGTDTWEKLPPIPQDDAQ